MHAGVAMLCVLQCGMYWDGSTICIYVLGLHVAVELPVLCCGWRLLWSPSALPSALHPRFSSTLHPLFIHSPSALHPLSSALSTLHPLSIRCCCLRTCATRSATAISLLLSDGSSYCCACRLRRPDAGAPCFVVAPAAVAQTAPQTGHLDSRPTTRRSGSRQDRFHRRYRRAHFPIHCRDPRGRLRTSQSLGLVPRRCLCL